MLIHAVDGEIAAAKGWDAEAQASLEAWLDETIGGGVNLHGSRLGLVSDATTIKVRRGELLVTDGPFAETKEQIAGFDVLDCSDLDEAIEAASKHPPAAPAAAKVVGTFPSRSLRASRCQTGKSPRQRNSGRTRTQWGPRETVMVASS
jgi:hypothetical protein